MFSVHMSLSVEILYAYSTVCLLLDNSPLKLAQSNFFTFKVRSSTIVDTLVSGVWWLLFIPLF